MNELDNGSDDCSDDFGTDYEDNVSEQSVFSDEKSAKEHTANPVVVFEDGDNTASAALGRKQGRGEDNRQTVVLSFQW